VYRKDGKVAGVYWADLLHRRTPNDEHPVQFIHTFGRFDQESGTVSGGVPLEDPQAELSVVDAIAPGGANRRAAIPIALSSSIPLAGYVVRLNGGEILDTASFNVRDLSPAPWRRHDGFGPHLILSSPLATLRQADCPAATILHPIQIAGFPTQRRRRLRGGSGGMVSGGPAAWGGGAG
jgi:hypothetical protein